MRIDVPVVSGRPSQKCVRGRVGLLDAALIGPFQDGQRLQVQCPGDRHRRVRVDDDLSLAEERDPRQDGTSAVRCRTLRACRLDPYRSVDTPDSVPA